MEPLPSHCNLLVKWHPNTYRQHEVKLEQIIGKYADRKNIVFLSDFPPIYPLLEVCDGYIGDMSSIGYDFLKFQRPMFFFNTQNRSEKTDPSLYLYRCGREILPEQFSSIFLSDEDQKLNEIQKETYDYAFDSDIDLKKVIASCALQP